MASYLDSASSATYFAERLGTEAWDNASATDRTKALAMATRFIDALPFVLTKTADDQEHAFPRDGMTTIPQEILDACCEVALAFLKGRTPDAVDESSRVQSESIGDVSATYAGSRADALAGPYGIPSTEALRLLSKWLRPLDSLSVERTS